MNIGVRLEPQFLREIHRIADRKELSVSATARHLMALGLEQLQQRIPQEAA